MTGNASGLSVHFKVADAASTYNISGLRSVDVMKYTKDVMTNQQSDPDITNLVSTLKGTNVTHIALSVPLDSTSDYPSSQKPAPRTAEAFTQKWADIIHGQGLRIIWRGTFSGLEGLYGFAKRVGTNRFPAGSAASAPSDGQSTWLGKIRGYIVNHPSYFADGDVWAPLPERTEGIFSDSTSFLSYASPGIQANYASFFNDLKTVSDGAFSAIGKRIATGLTANNYTEIASTWLPKSIFDNAGYVAVDYYGSTHTAAEMDQNMRSISASMGKPVFLEEWGDYWDTDLDQASRTAYLQSMYSEMDKLVKDGVLSGFNLWAGWANTSEGILTKDSNGFHLNYAGSILKDFFTTGALSNLTGSLLSLLTAPTVEASTPTVSCPQPAYNAFTGCYYKNQDLTYPVFTRTDPAINFDWGGGSPNSAMPVDHFSVRWQGTFPFSTGTYTFTTATDDGVRVYVDNQQVIDSWVNQPASPTKSGSKYISQGNHVVKVEYFENTGGSVAKLKWVKQ